MQARRTTLDGTTSRWTTTRYPGATQSATVPLTAGHQHCVRVRSIDCAGNASTWTAPQCTTRLLDGRALSAGAGWNRTTPAGRWNETATGSARPGATLTRAGVHARQVAILATTCPTCGSVLLFVGATEVGRLSLHSRTTRRSRSAPRPCSPTRPRVP